MDMQFRSLPWWLWLIPIVLLVIGIGRLPYSYYSCMRLVVCGFGVYFAVLSWRDGAAISKAWAATFVLAAILFNPIMPIHLRRATWLYLDIGGATLFAAHLLLVRRTIKS